MTVTFPAYAAAVPWYRRMPFDGVPQEPTLVRREDAIYQSWAPAPGNSTPSWVYVSTASVQCGTFYVQPGGWFDPGNHPNAEQYYVLRGALHLGNPDTGQTVEIRAGDAANIPALAYHHAWNFGSEVCEILWWVAGEMHTDEFKEAVGTEGFRWYPRDPVKLDGWPAASQPEDLAMRRIPKDEWRHLIHGDDPRLVSLRSLFYEDDQIRVGHLQLPASRDCEPEVRDAETLIYVTDGTLSVNLPGRATGLLARADDLVFVPPGEPHSLQAIGNDPVGACFAFARVVEA